MSNLFPGPRGFNGINLDNYFPNQRSYNSVVYVHKRFLNNPKDLEKEVKKDQKQIVTEKSQKDESNKIKKKNVDKGIQFDGLQNEQIKKKSRCINLNKDVVIDNTVQFAKKILPLILPSENYDEPVVFTVKTKKTKKKCRDYDNDKDLVYEKKKYKRANDSSHRPKDTNRVESLSIKESVSQLSQNTLDDFNINESLTCTISGISEKKYVKKERGGRNHKKNRKITVSNSLEALATETLDVNEGASIKIHLMNDTDKNNFSENIQLPIINAIKECITEMNQYNRIDSQLEDMQRFITYNNEKLCHIADKLTCLEKKIENNVLKQIEVIKPPNLQLTLSKSSKLEQLGEDIVLLSDNMSENESTEAVDEKKKYENKSVKATLDKNKIKNGKMKTLGGGESSSPFNTITEETDNIDKPNRIPARFCWTDAVRP